MKKSKVRKPPRKDEAMYCVYFITDRGECKSTTVHALNAKDAILCAKNIRGGDYGRTVEVYRMVREPVDF